MLPGTPASFLWLFFPSHTSHLLPSGQVFLPIILSLVWFSLMSAQNSLSKAPPPPVVSFFQRSPVNVLGKPSQVTRLQIVVQKEKKERKRTFYSYRPNPCQTLLLRVFKKKKNVCVNHHNQSKKPVPLIQLLLTLVHTKCLLIWKVTLASPLSLLWIFIIHWIKSRILSLNLRSLRNQIHSLLSSFSPTDTVFSSPQKDAPSAHLHMTFPDLSKFSGMSLPPHINMVSWARPISNWKLL